MKNGCVDFNANTLAYYNNNWWYVKNGHVDFSYNGAFDGLDGKVYYIRNGMVYMIDESK